MICPVLIIEDELVIAESISAILTEEAYQVAGIAANYAEAKAFFQKSPLPALVLCDMNLKGGEYGVDVVLKLKQNYDFEIIFITQRSDAKSVHEAMGIKPVNYLVKPFTEKQLLVNMQMATLAVYKKQEYENINLNLTQREIEIARLVAQGFSSKQIAHQLFISAETVRTHRKNMLQRNNLRSFSHLVYLLNQS
ncbi:MAG: DNA-binding response regulator [Bacteroidales bacterium]|nr:DNA-binding response regulator [Bacteroidales bacterium]